ncbi:MAG: hypothetical protein Q7J68_02405, partial [Thermoplasmata archaeon]|nr:hypothetical protein [Thermoplasmata archaeon]
ATKKKGKTDIEKKPEKMPEPEKKVTKKKGKTDIEKKPEKTPEPVKKVSKKKEKSAPEPEKAEPKKPGKKDKKAKIAEAVVSAPEKKPQKVEEPKTLEPKKPETKQAIKTEPAEEPEKVAVKEETIIEDELPIIQKKMDELTEDELHVLNAMSGDAMTMSGVQSKVGKHMKRFALLRALRVLIDSGYVGIIAKGRMELYQKIKVQQMDKMDNKKNKQEVK